MATFKARARTLDMLGRQQIAGIPTAIAELFKNAHDAYADRVEVDYFRSDKLFLLRDDGLGMTRQDFEDRWLTLGTESKLGGMSGLPPLLKDPDKPLRPVLGEKGIGRLAVAVVGPQMLVLTRVKSGDAEREIVAAFIHWGLFEVSGVDLDQIEVPIRTFRGGKLPTRADVRSMVKAVRENVRRLEHLIDVKQSKRLDADLASFDVDPYERDGYLDGPRLAGEGHGTHFYIKPASELLEADIEEGGDSGTAAPLIKLLIGFTNTMTPGHAPPVTKTSFRDHGGTGSYKDLIQEGSFFTPEEFKMADHHIVGTFDEYGVFSGNVTIYGENTFNHEVVWPSGRDKRTNCGPFKIELAYVQGAQRESKIPPEEYQSLVGKLNLIGGLYLYRDSIRILPYGDTDYDWLEIEKRRTYGAGYYYFSYRRMFGVVEISRKENFSLSEKAGREGFRENLAYRQFRSILKNFFIQIAADFFRETGDHADVFRSRRAEIERTESIRRERDKQATVERKAFSKRLENVFKRTERGEPQQAVNAILSRTSQATKAATKTTNSAQAAKSLIDAELAARRELNNLRNTYRLERPSGYGLSNELLRGWEAYQRESQGLEEEVFGPALERLDQITRDNVRQAHLEVDRRRRTEAVVRTAMEEARSVIPAETQETRRVMQEALDRVQNAVRDTEIAVDQAINGALDRVADGVSEGDGEATEGDIVEALMKDVDELVRRERRKLADLREQLHSILREGVATEVSASPLETLAALEEELLALRERSEADLELTQLGMAVGVINHEFNQMIASIRRNVRRLKPWADANPDLSQLYRELRTAFEHLDGYLTLLAPLQRRLYRKAIPITGREIAKYLRGLFSERLRRDNVQLEATPAFLEKRVVGFPSTFYPVFVNLIDNALFWLRDTREPRIIRLDTDGDALLICDTGPGIPNRDRDVIFEQGFTRKPGGRGLGLYISRSVLSKAGYQLEVTSSEGGQGATFRIEPI